MRVAFTGCGRVATEELGEGTMGYYSLREKKIVLRPAEPLQMVKTLADEAAHHELAQHFRERDDVAFTAAESESIAESAAYVVCSHIGLDTGARSFPYIALWSQATAVFRKVLTTVQKIPCQIIDGVVGTSKEADDLFPLSDSGRLY